MADKLLQFVTWARTARPSAVGFDLSVVLEAISAESVVGACWTQRSPTVNALLVLLVGAVALGALPAEVGEHRLVLVQQPVAARRPLAQGGAARLMRLALLNSLEHNAISTPRQLTAVAALERHLALLVAGPQDPVATARVLAIHAVVVLVGVGVVAVLLPFHHPVAA
eukprot:2337230-Rhodomonas_salina.1